MLNARKQRLNAPCLAVLYDAIFFLNRHQSALDHVEEGHITIYQQQIWCFHSQAGKARCPDDGRRDLQTHRSHRAERSGISDSHRLRHVCGPDIKLYICGKFTKADGTDLDATDYTAGTNNFLHSLFSQCTIALNGVNITQSGDLYNYRAYLEIILSYGNDTTSSHLTNSYWYKYAGDMLPCDPRKQSRQTPDS